ncbi:unnamed protein product, partial [Ectocarpus fasciculatus]
PAFLYSHASQPPVNLFRLRTGSTCSPRRLPLTAAREKIPQEQRAVTTPLCQSPIRLSPMLQATPSLPQRDESNPAPETHGLEAEGLRDISQSESAIWIAL